MNYKSIFLYLYLVLFLAQHSFAQISPSYYGFSGGPSLIPPAKLDLNASNSRSFSGSGTTWTSIGDVQYNTTLVNGVTFVENGDFDYMSFDGSNDYVETGKTASNLNIYDADYTMEAAVRFDNSSQGMVFGTSTTSYRQGLHVGAGSNARMYQGHYAMDGSSANNTLSNDVWYHLMWTFDKSAGEMKMYLDGSLIQTQTGKLSFLGTSNIMLSRFWAYSALDLAYARIYDTVFTSSQVSILYNEYNSVVANVIDDNLFLNVDASNSNSYSGSGTTWTDLTGNGYNGTLMNGPTYDSNNSGSIVTDGSNDYVLFGPLPYVGSSSSNLTWELWVNPSDSSGNVMSMSNTNPQSSWNMPPIAASGSKFIAKIWNNSILYADNTYSQGTWYHLVLTWDYNTNTQSLYVNGVLNDFQSGINYSASGANNYLFLGDDNPGANNTGMFGGKYGEFRVYNKALSSSEVLNNYNATKGRYGL
ncbi:MAG: LamG-like jellyroll fold domain-containing protein [Flavobacteriaceae bacterium]